MVPQRCCGGNKRILSYYIFRWYRSGWGRYTQGDRYLPLRWREPNTFAYVGDAPTRFADPKGLYRAPIFLYHHPFALLPYVGVLTALPQVRWESGKAFSVSGRTLADIFSLPPNWPKEG